MDATAGRYGVADGASEGCFTGHWARLLVERFVRGGEVTSWLASLPALQEQWDTEVRDQDLPWYAETGVSQGACSTFLGLMLKDSPLPQAGEGSGVREAPCRWQAVAVGDTCLLHTRGGTLRRAFPLDRSEQFDNFPKLVGSRMPVDAVQARQTLWIDGCGQPGDRLWMMTDALAQFCLGAIEAGGNPWNELESLLADDPNLPSPVSGRGAGGEGVLFTSWIETLRGAARLRNDDVTLLAIEL